MPPNLSLAILSLSLCRANALLVLGQHRMHEQVAMIWHLKSMFRMAAVQLLDQHPRMYEPVVLQNQDCFGRVHLEEHPRVHNLAASSRHTVRTAALQSYPRWRKPLAHIRDCSRTAALKRYPRVHKLAGSSPHPFRTVAL